jgi:hypothetical protein
LSERANTAEPPQPTHDPHAGVLYFLEPEGKRMIMSFSGLPAGVPMVPFEFVRMLSTVDVKTVFLRDHAQAWFHRGVRGVGDNIDAVAEHVRRVASQAEEVVMIGTSAGGYAALLFGAMTGCEAHAFVPQTFIDPELRAEHRDQRWAEPLAALGDDLDRRYADLLPTVAAGTAPAHLYYGQGHAGLDRVHAERLAPVPHVTLHAFESTRHALVQELRDSGWLGDFLQGLARGSL